MKIFLALVVLLFAACAMANAQTAPAATKGGAILDYSLYFSQTAIFRDSTEGNQVRGTASGDLDYKNGSERLPFGVNFAGGYNWAEAGRPYGVGFFENLVLSQGIFWRKTSLTVEDALADRPGAAVSGFSGVPGTGEPVGGSGNPTTSETVLTLDTRILSNIVKGTIYQGLDHATNLSGGGSSEILRFNTGDGIDTDVNKANAGISRRLNALNSLTGEYAFTQFLYPDSGQSFFSNAVTFGIDRKWNRRWSTIGSVGPAWITSSDSSLVPSTIRVTGTAEIDYKYRYDAAGLKYVHGTSSGSGYLLGAESDLAVANYLRDFGRTFSIGFEGSYRRLAGLVNNGVTNGKTGAVRAGWRLGRHFDISASYTALDQTSSSALVAGALNSFVQEVSFSIRFWPRGNHNSSGNGP